MGVEPVVDGGEFGRSKAWGRFAEREVRWACLGLGKAGMTNVQRGVKWLGMLVLLGCGAAASAQALTGWTVKPEWVRAHEEFLASDVMQGRGSATRDEEITATYVVSEFMGYGLKPAPGMSGYLQSAEVVAPELDGQATLSAGGVELKEGAEFEVLISPGESVRGPLLRVKASEV